MLLHTPNLMFLCTNLFCNGYKHLTIFIMIKVLYIFFKFKSWMYLGDQTNILIIHMWFIIFFTLSVAATIFSPAVFDENHSPILPSSPLNTLVTKDIVTSLGIRQWGYNLFKDKRRVSRVPMTFTSQEEDGVEKFLAGQRKRWQGRQRRWKAGSNQQAGADCWFGKRKN